MPSVIVTGQSGGMLVISGNFFSGRNWPVGGIQFRNDKSTSGNIYIAMSGNVTVTSGSYPLSGGIYSGGLDGFPLAPGDAYFIPMQGIQNKGPNSGNVSIYAALDAAASGFNRLYFEGF